MDVQSDILLSVVICTHRRPDSLQLVLETLAQQVYDGDDWEVILVENDTEATDEIAEVVNKYSTELPFRWVLESIPNLSRARNRGADEARGSYIAYIDDDVELMDGWLSTLADVCRRYQPSFCSGPAYPLFRTPRPYWYKEEWAVTGYRGDKILEVDDHFSGMNFIVRREIVLELGGFSEGLGMSGSKIAYGEETDLMMRARRKWPDLTALYVPGVALKHEVRPVKLTVSWILKSEWATGRDMVAMGKWPSNKQSSCKLAVRIFLELMQVALLLIGLFFVMLRDLFRLRQSLWKRYVKEHISDRIRKLSLYYHAIRQGR